MELSQTHLLLQGLKPQDLVLTLEDLPSFDRQIFGLFLEQIVELLDFGLKVLQRLVEFVGRVLGLPVSLADSREVLLSVHQVDVVQVHVVGQVLQLAELYSILRGLGKVVEVEVVLE